MASRGISKAASEKPGTILSVGTTDENGVIILVLELFQYLGELIGIICHELQVLVFHIYPGVSFPHSSLDNTLGGIGDLADRDGDLQDICFRIFDRGGEGFLVRTEVDDGLDP